MNLSDYCVICGRDAKDSIHFVGYRGPNGDVSAFICDSCDYIYRQPSSRMRFITIKKRWLRPDLGYYIAAKPCDAEDWQDVDRIWLEVDRVYETRWDCNPMPERVRLAA